ncbi:N-acetyl-glucosamine-6-phosphate deacetylase [Podochytrium sp. JEL0797]|nr:N-acetyl-glucosamine-6-phosphate deacetylase [Podochytrium sp. JEL0797]
MQLLAILAATSVAVSAQTFTAVAGEVAPISHNLLWPRPQAFTSGSTTHSINPEALTFNINGGNQAILTKAVNRFTSNALAIGCNTAPTYGCSGQLYGDITTVTITVSGADVDLAVADESYTLTTSDTGVTITAKQTVGAIRALETFTQLVMPVSKLPDWVATDAAGCAAAAAAGLTPGFVIPDGPWSIQDHPSYSYRGVSLDTARNFMSVATIKRTLDGMVASKLNVLNWHIVDATSFPMVSKTYPDLSNAAYDAMSVYSYADVADVIAYAADRGIRVIPEFDTPAHTNALSLSPTLAKYVLCANGGAAGTNSFWPTCPEPPCGNLNIADPGAAPAIGALLAEYAALFTDSVMHLGGDEMENFCLGTSPEFMNLAFPTSTNISSIYSKAGVASPDFLPGVNAVYQKYIDTVLKSVGGKTTMHWEDIVIENAVQLPKGSIIQIWNSWDNKASKNSMQKVLDLNAKGAGYQIVDTNNDYYYLDGGSGAWLTDRGFGPGGDSWKQNYWTNYKTWERVYTHDPRTSAQENTTDTSGTGLAGKLVGDTSAIIGAAAAIWGERIDSSNLDVKLWPRAAAMAEALWSADAFPTPDAKDFFEALPRLQVFRDRLVSRGYEAENLQPYWCRSAQCAAAFSGYGKGLAYGNQIPSNW